jgi:hypothetical protein
MLGVTGRAHFPKCKKWASRASISGPSVSRPTGIDAGQAQLRLIATILRGLTAFPAVFKTLTAFATILKPLATILKALTAFLALTAYEALAVSTAITALIETRAIPAVEVKA